MAALCEQSPIPIALDEELIGISKILRKTLIDTIRPQFIILKPTLLGGFEACIEWITLAQENKIGWWITSALESNIGLNAISQFTSTFDIEMPQGLGTGNLYSNNVSSPLTVNNGFIKYDNSLPWGRVF